MDRLGGGVQLGFVIDHSKCIGCHACTVACKAENDVPLGAFRTWVKYVEHGAWPQVKRSFAVLRCNQCTDAPCVTICPVRALHKRDDGIVDIDPQACIGCKACMQGCPYDALYIDDDRGIAAKCHFCAHRTEVGLAPACAVVCPTEAIVPGDFHDRESAVSKLRREHDLVARKVEAETGPNVLYREVDDAAVDPLRADASGGYLWASRGPDADPDVERFQAALEDAESRARSVYDVDHRAWWGGKVSAYLWTKSLAAGALLVTIAMLGDSVGGGESSRSALPALVGLPAIGIAFLAVTSILLIADLKRPERFAYILLRPNPRSWLVRGAWVLMAYGAIATAWIFWAVVARPDLSGSGVGPIGWTLAVLGAIAAVLTAGYTGWLFAQAKGRVLWMQRGLWLRFAFHAAAAGGGLALVLAPILGLRPSAIEAARALLLLAILAEAIFAALERKLGPVGRDEEFRRARALVKSGPFSGTQLFGEVLAFFVPVTLVVLGPHVVPGATTAILALAGASVLAGIAIEQHVLVRAGQALPIS